MPELQPHVAFDTEKRVVYTIRCTDVLPLCESSNDFGSMAIVVVVVNTGENAVPGTSLILVAYPSRLLQKYVLGY